MAQSEGVHGTMNHSGRRRKIKVRRKAWTQSSVNLLKRNELRIATVHIARSNHANIMSTLEHFRSVEGSFARSLAAGPFKFAPKMLRLHKTDRWLGSA